MVTMVMGTVFGIWGGYGSLDLSASAYVEQQQNLIRNLNVLMPALGLFTILITLLAAFMHAKEKPIMFALLIAALFFITTGMITRFGNQVINAEVITWNSADPPANWREIRDRWWMLHSFRTVTALIGMVIVYWVHTSRSKTA